MENPNPYLCTTEVHYNEALQCFEVAFHLAGKTTILLIAKASARDLQSQIAYALDELDYLTWEQRTIAEPTQLPEGWDA